MRTVQNKVTDLDFS